MDGPTEQLALRYVDYLRTGHEEILAEAFAADHLDNVSGQRAASRSCGQFGAGSKRASLTLSTRCTP